MNDRRRRATEALRGLKVHQINDQTIVEALMSDELKAAFNGKEWSVDDWNLMVAEDIASMLEDDNDDSYMKLPKDANGEYIHLHDKMRNTATGEEFTVRGIGVNSDNPALVCGSVIFFRGNYGITGEYGHYCEHRKMPTVEDVLNDFFAEARDIHVLCDGYWDRVSDIVAKYSAKLRLREEEWI